MKQHSKYNKEDYSRIVKCNSNRNDFICPECGLSFPISDESIGEGCAIEDADFADDGDTDFSFDEMSSMDENDDF